MNSYKVTGTILLISSIVCTIINAKINDGIFEKKHLVFIAIMGIVFSILMMFLDKMYEKEAEKINDGQAHLFTLNEEVRWLNEKSPSARRVIGNIFCFIFGLFPFLTTIVILFIKR